MHRFNSDRALHPHGDHGVVGSTTDCDPVSGPSPIERWAMSAEPRVLEKAGLVTTAKVGRVRTCRLGLRRLDEEAAWIERYRQLWDARFDELDKVVEELKRKEKVDGRKKRK